MSLDRQHCREIASGTQPTRDPVCPVIGPVRSSAGALAAIPDIGILGRPSIVSRATNAKSIPVNRIVMLGRGPPDPGETSLFGCDSTITFSGRMRGKS